MSRLTIKDSNVVQYHRIQGHESTHLNLNAQSIISLNDGFKKGQVCRI